MHLRGGCDRRDMGRVGGRGLEIMQIQCSHYNILKMAHE